MKRLVLWLTTAATVLTLACTVVAPVAATVSADASTDAAKAAACEGAGGKIDGKTGQCVTPGPSLDTVILNIIKVLTIIIGMIAVIMLIVGGLKYITSAGDSGKLTSAKNTIIYSIVGIIVVAMSQIIIRYVLDILRAKQ